MDLSGRYGPGPVPTSAEDHGPGRPASPGRRTGPHVLCHDLFKIYKRADLEVVALRGLDLEMETGEMVAVVGASGSGKSTLLNILSGLDRPSAGQMLVGGRDLLNISEGELVVYRRLEVGFVWQATAWNLVPYLSARDNIVLPMAIAGQDVKLRKSRSQELLEALGMADMADRLPHQLSGGEQQRVAIGVAMANLPPLLLADEPTGELDTHMASEVFELLRQMNRIYGVSVMVVTHYPGVAQHVDRILQIRDGRISTESSMKPSFQREGGFVQEEYLVVDRAGRLQLPPEYIEKLHLRGLAKADMDGDQVTIRHPGNSPSPGPTGRAAEGQDP